MSGIRAIKIIKEKVNGAKDHGKTYIKVRPPCSAIFCVIVYLGYSNTDFGHSAEQAADSVDSEGDDLL